MRKMTLMSQRIKAMKVRYHNEVVVLRCDPKNDEERNL